MLDECLLNFWSVWFNSITTISIDMDVVVSCLVRREDENQVLEYGKLCGLDGRCVPEQVYGVGQVMGRMCEQLPNTFVCGCVVRCNQVCIVCNVGGGGNVILKYHRPSARGWEWKPR